MKTMEVSFVRLYIKDPENRLRPIMKRLNDWGRVKGISVSRGMVGFASQGVPSSAQILNSLQQVSEQAPVVVEFFDEPGKVSALMDYLQQVLGAEHIVSWQAQAAMAEDQKTENLNLPYKNRAKTKYVRPKTITD